MRVAMFVEGLLLPSAEGATWRFLQLLRGLSEMGAEVVVFHSFRGWSDPKQMAMEPYRVILIQPSDYYNNPKFIEALLRRYKIDMVISKDPSYLRSLAQSGGLPEGTKTIFDCHDLHQSGSTNWSEQTWAIENVDVVIAINEREFSALKILRPYRPVIYIPSTVSTSEISNKQHELESNKIVFLGHFYYEPNLDAARWLAQVIFPLVLAAIPEAQLHLVGAYPPTAFYDINGSAIYWNGYADDLNIALSQYDVAFSGVRIGSGFRIKTLHYMKAGLPVVSNHLGVEGVGYRDCFKIAEKDDELSTHIVKLLQSPPDRNRLAQAGADVLKQEFCTDRLHNLLHELFNLASTQTGMRRTIFTHSSVGAAEMGWWNEIVSKGRFLKLHSNLFPVGTVVDLKNAEDLESILCPRDSKELAI